MRAARRSGGAAGRALALAGLLVAAGCASTPARIAASPAPPRPDEVQAERERVASLETEMARRAAAAGRLHEALWRWRAVEAVARDPAEARREAATLSVRMGAEADAEVARGEAARRARDPAGATAAFARALALDPKRPAVLAYLREAETAAVLKAVAQEQSAARRRRPRAAKAD